MQRHAAKLILLSAFGLALAACTSYGQKDPDPNIVPTNYKQEILDTLSHTLEDPTNLRDTYVSEPVLALVNKEQRYTACVRFNERGFDHKYVGIKDRIAYFYAGHLNQLVDASPEQCGKAAYKPFPELGKLCLGKSCR